MKNYHFKIFYFMRIRCRYLIFLFIIFSFIACDSVPNQTADSPSDIDQLDASLFSIIDQGDTIQFIKVDTDLENPKPTILFFQGSLPVPLVIDFNDGVRDFVMFHNFDYKKLSEKYNLVIISMPFVPAIVPETLLNKQWAYITDKSDEFSFPEKYQEANYLDKYVERGEAVIQFLMQQKWVDKKHIILFGHSQGCKVGTKIAAKNEHVSAFAFFSGNPLGRIDQYIRSPRLKAQKGQMDPEEAQKQIDGIYDWWKWMIENPDEIPQHKGDRNKATISFSTSLIDDLTNMKIPIYIAYGTEDIAASYCDLLPIDFIRAGKKNYKVTPYVGLEHNFMKVDSLGNPIPTEFYWEKAMDDFIEWLEKESGIFEK